METPSLSVLQPRFQESSALISVTIRDAGVDDMERKVLEGNHGNFQQTTKEFCPLGDRDQHAHLEE